MQAEDRRANNGARPYDNCFGQLGIDQLVEVVNQKALGERRSAGADFEPLLRQRERARPWAKLDGNSPKQRCNVQPGERAPAPRQHPAKQNPQDPEQMH